jgi:hypothetical protein
VTPVLDEAVELHGHAMLGDQEVDDRDEGAVYDWNWGATS